MLALKASFLKYYYLIIMFASLAYLAGLSLKSYISDIEAYMLIPIPCSRILLICNFPKLLAKYETIPNIVLRNEGKSADAQIYTRATAPKRAPRTAMTFLSEASWTAAPVYVGAIGVALEGVPAVIPAGTEEVGLRVNELWVVTVGWLTVVVL